MKRVAMAAGLFMALTGCSATPTGGEIMENDVRMQPVAVSTDADPALCSARALLMHRAEVSSDWNASIQTPATIHVPRNARVVELLCVAGDRSTTRFLKSEEGSEAKNSSAATGAMFVLLGGLPALATGAMQRTDVYEFSPTITVALPPSRETGSQARSAFVSRRMAELAAETSAWHEVRRSMCTVERERGNEFLDSACERALAAIDERREQLETDLKTFQTAQN